VAETSAKQGSIRNAIRWGFLLAAVGTIGFRLPRLGSEARQWRGALRLGEAAAAEGWRAVLLVDCVGALVVLVIGGVVFYALRTPAKSAR
jgi:hypothetical protein